MERLGFGFTLGRLVRAAVRAAVFVTDIAVAPSVNKTQQQSQEEVEKHLAAFSLPISLAQLSMGQQKEVYACL